MEARVGGCGSWWDASAGVLGDCGKPECNSCHRGGWSEQGFAQAGWDGCCNLTGLLSPGVVRTEVANRPGETAVVILLVY